MSAEGVYYLAGALIPPPGHLIYRSPDHEREKELKLYLKGLGKLVEKGALGLWSGQIKPDTEVLLEMKCHFNTLVNQTTGSFHRTSSDITLAYQKICQENPNEPQVPANPNVLHLAQLVDTVCHVNTLEFYAQLISVDQGDGIKDLKDYRARHWLEATLAVARQYLDSLKFPVSGKFLPDVHPSGGNFGQFDGLIVSPNITVDIDWLHPPAYHPVEVKTPFRIEDIKFPSRRVGGQNEHLHQMKQRLAQIALKQSASGVEPYFPTSAYFCYLRGSTPSSLWVVSLNSSFFEHWVDDIDLDIGRLIMLPAEHQTSAINLIHILQARAQKLRTQEALKNNSVQDFSVLIPGMLDPRFPEPLPRVKRSNRR